MLTKTLPRKTLIFHFELFLIRYTSAPDQTKAALASLGKFGCGWEGLTTSEGIVSYVIFSWRLTPCKISKTLNDSFQRYYWSKNPAIWLEQGILPLNFGTKISQDMQCLQNVTALIVHLRYPIFRQIQFQNHFLVIFAPGGFSPKHLTLSETTPHGPVKP